MRWSGLLFVTVLSLAACGDNRAVQPDAPPPDGASAQLSDFYPALPDPTGGARTTFAGAVTQPSQLLVGPAVSGLVGDYYLKNDVATFIVQAPTRVIGVIPQGGNLVDIALTDGATQLTPDQFGELGLIYKLGRTCEPDHIDIVRDGSGGGVAVLRAVGKSGIDDFINIKGIGSLPVDPTVDPDVPDGILCATTYILYPGATYIEVHHTLFNAGPDLVWGPMGTIADTGGSTDGWTDARGFEAADISNLANLSIPEPANFAIYQAPGVAYGIIPRHDQPTIHAAVNVSGVSIILDGDAALLDILTASGYYLKLEAGQGKDQRVDVAVGHDAADIDAIYRKDESLRTISGSVTLSDGSPAIGARVGVFVDGNHNGVLDDADTDLDGDQQPDDRVISYFDVAADGTFHGKVSEAGNLLLRAEVQNVGRSPAAPIADTMSFTIPKPIRVDFTVEDTATGAPIPARILVVGDHPAFPDTRVFPVTDRLNGVVTQEHAIRGTTVDLGDGVDEPLYLPAGGTYRIFASRGTEWSADSAAVGPGATSVDLTFHLTHVVPTPGYYATDWHVHQIGSPDSNIASDERVRSAVSAGVEMFAVTDHDYVSDLEPIVQELGLDHLLRVVPGIEVTPFPYGHFNTWPLVPDDDSANHGAIDWARGGTPGDAMIPGEIFAAMRARGGQMVQVNHPRITGFTEFQAAFDRANVKYDYANRTIYGDYQDASVPNADLRLPGVSLWSDQFTGLEIWNGFAIGDSNHDGVREVESLDHVMRDWLSMLSLGFEPTPAGDSDTHTTVADPAGMPRTYVRVANDSADALADGTAVDAVVQTQTGANSTPRDVVVTDGPMIGVTVGGQPALGSVWDGSGGITLTVTIQAADWAQFDTLEVFANTTPEAAPAAGGDTTLQPLRCWTSRAIASLAANDPCATASLEALPMTVTLVPVGPAQRFEATVTVTLDAADIDTRQGATGTDAWLVFRARGSRAVFPLMPGQAITDATLPVILAGDPAAMAAALTGVGVPATAVTSPVYVDFDGGGYRAPFAP
ncbi:MAG TPA: CehA/McbA family metallohydrolase [Kofleriaceae bacterium]|jgi:hypothetical protein